MKNSAFIKLATEQDSAYEDLYTEYGVSFIKGSYLKLLNMSQAKEYVKNNNRLEHGTRYLASSTYAKLSERNVSLEVLMEASTKQEFVTRYENFTSKVANGMVYLKIPSVFRVFKLVYSDIEVRQEYRNQKAIFVLKLTEPNPKDRIVIT